MILIPYFWNTDSPDWIHFGVFLCSGGRSLWSLDSGDDIKETLRENGFPLVRLLESPDSKVTYAQIDYKNMKMENFYTWNEIDYRTSDSDVWRITKIPATLWSCEVFKQHFWKSLDLHPVIDFTGVVSDKV